MEIERKFLIKTAPADLEQYPHYEIEQGYLCTSPVLRIRRKGDSYIFTYKSAGLMTREEIEVPLSEESYQHLLPKCDGNPITKTRYKIPEPNLSASGQPLTIEFDVFHGALEGLLLAEVEFASEEDAHAYSAPDWFTVEVTKTSTFHNSQISSARSEDILREAVKLLTQRNL